MSSIDGKLTLTRADLERLLPHEDTAICIDEVTLYEAETNYALGLVNLSVVSHYFRGHFKDKPILPAHWQVEMIALTAGILVKYQFPEIEDYLVLTSLGDKQKLRIPIIPPQTITLKVSLKRMKHKRGTFFVSFDGEVILPDGRTASEFKNVKASTIPKI